MQNYQYFDMAQKNYDFYTKYAIFEGKTERLSRTCNIIELGWYKNFIELNIFKEGTSATKLNIVILWWRKENPTRADVPQEKLTGCEKLV